MKIQSLKSLCRVCLENETTQSIYDKDETGMLIFEKITLCDIQIKTDKGWPDKICDTCLQNLNTSYKFRTQCKNSDNLLLEILDGGMQSYYGTYESDDQDAPDNSEIIFLQTTDDVAKRVSSGDDTDETDDRDQLNKELTAAEDCEVLSEPVPSEKVRKKKKSRRKSPESKCMHICEICGNMYQYKSALEVHMRRHTNNKPFSCEICGRAFALNGQLTCHMRTHTGEKPYECRFCKRRYADIGARQVHERTHTGERPFKCDVCNKAFTYASVLKKHKLTHTDEKQFSCGFCDKQFRLRYHLTAHLNTAKHQGLTVVAQTPSFED